jgi:hypothetical protein
MPENSGDGKLREEFEKLYGACRKHGPYIRLCGACVEEQKRAKVCVACVSERRYRDALNAILTEIKARAWLREGRGPYEWNDDDYRREAGWCMDAVRKIAEEALK